MLWLHIQCISIHPLPPVRVHHKIIKHKNKYSPPLGCTPKAPLPDYHISRSSSRLLPNVDVSFCHPETIEHVLSHAYTWEYQVNRDSDHAHVYFAAKHLELHKVQKYASKGYKLWAYEDCDTPELSNRLKIC